MTTKLIVKEFKFQPSENFAPGLVNRTLDVWPSFLNNYGVWPNYGNGVETHVIPFSWTPVKGGEYTFRATCDNSFKWEIANAWVEFAPTFFSSYAWARITPAAFWPGVSSGPDDFAQVLSGNSWQTIYSTIPRTWELGSANEIPDQSDPNKHVGFEYAQFQANNAGKGPIKMRFHVTNTGGPAGFAATITNSDGVIEWNSRNSFSDTSTGRYKIDSFPFTAEIVVHAWGAGGGAGGADGGTLGGPGAPGSYNTTTFEITRGQSLEVCIGEHGQGGVSSRGGAIGGPGGRGRTNLDSGDSTTSFNGGKGGQAGPIPSSGGGGGGGGASLVLVDDILKCCAFGGAGGGGAGNDGNGSDQTTRRTATTSNNATGVSGSDYRGENGQNKSGDGGGGGGGGGGFPGGQGGAVMSTDASAYAGQSGGNFPANPYSTGSDSVYFKSGFASGGTASGTGGSNGRVILEIRPLALISIKDSGEWKQIRNAYTKVSGDWKEINTVYTKVNGSWKQIEGTGQAEQDFILGRYTTNYNRVSRPYS